MTFRQKPLSLADQAGLVIIEHLLEKTRALESQYLTWLYTLKNTLRQKEESMSMNSVNPSEVVYKYQQKVREQQRVKPKRRGTGKKSKRSAKKEDEDYGKAIPDPPDGGIPPEEDPDEYIQYRKCLYLDSIKRFRAELCLNLSTQAIEHLLSLQMNLFRKSKSSQESGLFSLQLLLITEYSQAFSFIATLHNPFYSSKKYYTGDCYRVSEHKVGPTVLRSVLMESSRLSSLSLERVCNDKLLGLVGKHVKNLRYLNISNSVVTDQGLLNLVGVETLAARTRQRLPRTCKTAPCEVHHSFHIFFISSSISV